MQRLRRYSKLTALMLGIGELSILAVETFPYYPQLTHAYANIGRLLCRLYYHLL